MIRWPYSDTSSQIGQCKRRSRPPGSHSRQNYRRVGASPDRLDDSRLVSVAVGQPLSFEIVAGIDAFGFILGSALALRAGTGFIPIRKEGKFTVLTDRAVFVDYTGTQKALELHHDAVLPRQRVLIVDEWIETGARVRAAIRLTEKRGGIIAGVATIHIDANNRIRPLTERYPCTQVWLDSK